MSNLKSRIDSELTIVRLSYLLQEGFTNRELSDLTGVNFNTLKKILSAHPKKVTIATHEKVKTFHSNYIINKTNIQNAVPEDDEPVIDFADSEEGAKEVALWLGITIVVLLLATLGLIFVIKYIFSL